MAMNEATRLRVKRFHLRVTFLGGVILVLGSLAAGYMAFVWTGTDLPNWLYALAPLFAQAGPSSSEKSFLVDFEAFKPDRTPPGFSTALTGKGEPGQWVVREDSTAPSGRKVLAQLSADRTDYRFPLCVRDGFTARDAEVSVRFKPVSGKIDQAAGLVWRYRDAGNYYIVRANALESNVVLYKVQNGRRIDLKPKGSARFAYGKKAKVSTGKWSELKVTAKANTFVVHLNGTALFEVEDDTFQEPGRVGLWTKADSVIHFDDWTAVPLDAH